MAGVDRAARSRDCVGEGRGLGGGDGLGGCRGLDEEVGREVVKEAAPDGGDETVREDCACAV